MASWNMINYLKDSCTLFNAAGSVKLLLIFVCMEKIRQLLLKMPTTLCLTILHFCGHIFFKIKWHRYKIVTSHTEYKVLNLCHDSLHKSANKLLNTLLLLFYIHCIVKCTFTFEFVIMLQDATTDNCHKYGDFVNSWYSLILELELRS